MGRQNRVVVVGFFFFLYFSLWITYFFQAHLSWFVSRSTHCLRYPKRLKLACVSANKMKLASNRVASHDEHDSVTFSVFSSSFAFETGGHKIHTFQQICAPRGALKTKCLRSFSTFHGRCASHGQYCMFFAVDQKYAHISNGIVFWPTASRWVHKPSRGHILMFLGTCWRDGTFC